MAYPIQPTPIPPRRHIKATMIRTVVYSAFVAAAVAVNTTVNPPELAGMMQTLTSFENIAKVNSGSRSIAKGYNDSAAYVMKQLAEYSDVLDVVTQHFIVPVATEVAPPVLTLLGASPNVSLVRCNIRTGWQHYETACDYSGLRYGGNTGGEIEVNGAVRFVEDPCTAAGFSNFPMGDIALVTLTSSCDYLTLVTLAQAAGATAVFVSGKDGSTSLPGGRVFDGVRWTEEGHYTFPHIPTISITAAVRGLIVQSKNPLSARLVANAKIDLEHTYNVIAQSRTGNLDEVVMVGSHLDSVPEGPGINDNGSGSSLNLELAIQYAKSKIAALKKWGKKAATEDRAVRFAWWGAEEIGLMGSNFYVNDLQVQYPDEIKRIVAYLNFDMEAGPNYVRMVYDGETAPEEAKSGSVALMKMFEQAWIESGHSYEKSAMTGGSDFFPFIMADVPSSGIATGAGSLKSEELREKHGGLANTPLDPCYHAPCDTVANVDQNCLTECAGALYKVFNQLLSVETAMPARPQHSAEDQLKLYRKNIAKNKKGFTMSCDAKEEDEVEEDEY